ncbi:PIN domain-containing protein [Sphaerotilus sp.]|uniref:PIN domain-containing protein n=1 Tax=Sphaerotilus sp. TaxID=2093942 RepID=UPI002ACE6A0B|nr:PIN domain-containing protein [Sphaerotilus sp.]MDZ7855045.1 PIN domain-containing protein [Sphaerotilus sp.]
MPAEVFIDSNVWLYALIETSRPDPRAATARALIAAQPRPVISTQVIREVSVNLLRKAGVAEAAIRELVRSWYADCLVTDISEAQFLHASQLREQLSISYWDSLIVAAALDAGCVMLYSEDMQHGQVIEGRLTILNPFRTTKA